MFLSRKCVYGLRAILYIAQNNKNGYVSISEISEKLKISFHFLTKILQILTQHQILVSYRGPAGGINLAKSAAEISIIDIIHLIDGDQVFQECILGLSNCDDNNPCPLHDQWTKSCQILEENFSDTNLNELVLKIGELNLRLAGD